MLGDDDVELHLSAWCAAGKSFAAVFGGNQSQLESLLLKRKVMGPSWLLLKHPTRVEPQAQVGHNRTWAPYYCGQLLSWGHNTEHK